MGRGLAIYVMGILAITGFAIAGRQYPDTDLLVIYALAVLTFPSGLLCIWALGLVSWALSISIGFSLPAGLLGSCIYISIAGIGGYVQWKMLTDWLNRPPQTHI